MTSPDTGTIDWSGRGQSVYTAREKRRLTVSDATDESSQSVSSKRREAAVLTMPQRHRNLPFIINIKCTRNLPFINNINEPYAT